MIVASDLRIAEIALNFAEHVTVTIKILSYSFRIKRFEGKLKSCLCTSLFMFFFKQQKNKDIVAKMPEVRTEYGTSGWHHGWLLPSMIRQSFVCLLLTNSFSSVVLSGPTCLLDKAVPSTIITSMNISACFSSWYLVSWWSCQNRCFTRCCIIFVIEEDKIGTKSSISAEWSTGVLKIFNWE